ncbi:cupin domain-containing protein [Streptomyces sp. NPDC052701]|uniref:cupin domain-containing protein n=1 Tax=Streptomyces sp. NPDC052701 TaxID=3155533 RepID=UPI00341C1B2B
MPDQEVTQSSGEQPRTEASAVTVLQQATPPYIPEGGVVVTAVIEWPPGDPGTPPHRHTGPAFGYVLEGAIRFEVEGQPERIIEAGETFWEPGGDVIHYQDGNARTDCRSCFLVTLVCEPGKPLLTPVDAEELARRAHLRAPRSS